MPLAGDPLHGCASSDVCRIVLTSGTTGEPKAVAITHKMLFDRIGRHHGIFGPRLAPCSRIFSDLSYSTSLGYQFLIYTLWRGGTFFATGDNFDRNRFTHLSNTKCNVGWHLRPAWRTCFNIIRSMPHTRARSISLFLVVTCCPRSFRSRSLGAMH